MKVMNQRWVRISKRLDPLWQALSWLSPEQAPANGPPPSILVIDLHLLGDIVMLTPLLASLKRRYPATRIVLLAGPWAAAVLAGNGVVDEHVVYEAPWVRPQSRVQACVALWRVLRRLRSLKPSWGIDVRGDLRQILLLWLVGCRRRISFAFTGGAALLTDVVPDDGRLTHILDHHERLATTADAWDGTPFVPVVVLTDAERQKASGIAPYVGVHFGASLPLRRLPVDDAAALLVRLSLDAERMVLFAAADLEPYLQDVLTRVPPSLQSQLSMWKGELREFMVYLSRASRVVAMDSGPAHLAAALGRATTVFFGPNLPEISAPRGPDVRIVERAGLWCRPCDQHRCVNPVHQACLRGLREA